MDQVTFQGWLNKISVEKIEAIPLPALKGKKDAQVTGMVAEFADELRSSTVFAGFIPDPQILEAVLDWVGQPIFLCGMTEKDQGGLQHSLARHPNLLVLPGNFYFYKKQKIWLDVCFIDIAREGLAYLINPPGSDIHWVLGQDVAIYEQYLRYLHFFLHYSKQNALICMVMALYAAAPARFAQTKYWVEKSVDNEQHVYSLLETFPGAKFIHLTNHATPSSLHFAQTNLEQLSAERYHLLRLEDLLEHEDQALQDVCDFLSIQFNPQTAA
jgi:hypothetical protein